VCLVAIKLNKKIKMANKNAKGRKVRDSVTISGDAISPYKIVDEGSVYKVFKGDKKSIDSYHKDIFSALDHIARKKIIMEENGKFIDCVSYVDLLQEKISYLRGKYSKYG
jgi:hypothetical protein